MSNNEDEEIDDDHPTSDIEEGAPASLPAEEAADPIVATARREADAATVVDSTPVLLRGGATPIVVVVDDDDDRPSAPPSNEGVVIVDERTSVIAGRPVVSDYGAGGVSDDAAGGVEGGHVLPVGVGASLSSSSGEAVAVDNAAPVASPRRRRRVVVVLALLVLAAAATTVGVSLHFVAPGGDDGDDLPTDEGAGDDGVLWDRLGADDDEVLAGDNVRVGAFDDDEALFDGEDVGADDVYVGVDEDEVIAASDVDVEAGGKDVGAFDVDVEVDEDEVPFAGDVDEGAGDDEVLVGGDNVGVDDVYVGVDDDEEFAAGDVNEGAGDDDVVAADDFANGDVRLDFPEWSWDHVRTYAAIRRGDDYSYEQIRALADQDIVVLEKFNGHETHGFTEKGALVAARRIKSLGTKVKILFYLNSMVHYEGYDANKDFKEEWALSNPSNNQPIKWRGKFLSYDHTNLEFREWWIQRGLDMLAHDEIDGIFIDAICKISNAALVSIKGEAWVEQHGEAYLATAKQLRERLPPGKILIGNVLRAAITDGNYRNLQYLDGSYLENWADPQHLVMSIQLMKKALNEGYLIMLNADMSYTDFGGIDSLDARYDLLNQPEFIDFPLGCFLLVVEPHAYFSYHSGVDANPSKLDVFDNNRFEAITRKLGKPLGDYADEGGGGFSREFEHLKVHVNMTLQQGTLSVTDRPTSTLVGNSSSVPTLSPTEPTQTCIQTSENSGRLNAYECPCLALGCVSVEPRCCSNKCRITMRNVSFCID